MLYWYFYYSDLHYRERDSLLEQLSSLRAQHTALRQREDEAYEQVKGSVQLVEQAQMELTQVHILVQST